ncbi:uracil-DNA glycosylase [Aurantibacter sp.]|uniref:uracil-DNA glycosylase n=1 Tax=Aurantibacter sp. TaxID=2807103 RepID=UPI0035C805CC
MLDFLNEEWKQVLKEELNLSYFNNLESFVKDSYKNEQCFPPLQQIFKAFNSCVLGKIKVVIIGQDPYHNYNQANGLCFSVNANEKLPPSLKNIFKELETDVGKPIPKSGNLSEWANQGVFLLNSTLTVEAHKPGSHQNKGWETFTDQVIKIISDKTESVVFLLWGGFAKKKSKLIDKKKHYILIAPHPSPLSSYRGWFGSKHFSQTNEILIGNNKKPIDW